MVELEARLKDCFRVVFPALADGDIERAAQVVVPEWDSLQTVTLVAVVEEEFGVECNVEDISSFVSYDQIRNLLLKKIAA